MTDMPPSTDGSTPAETACPDWYLVVPSDPSGSTPSIAQSLGLHFPSSPPTVVATHPSDPTDPKLVTTSNGMGHLRCTVPGKRASLRLTRHTHDGEPDTSVEVLLEPQLHLVVLLPSQPGDVYELKRVDTSPEQPSDPSGGSLMDLSRREDVLLDPSWQSSDIPLTSGGRFNTKVQVLCSTPARASPDGQKWEQVNLVVLEEKFKGKTGAYAISAQDVLSTGLSHGLFWTPSIRTGFAARPESGPCVQDAEDRMTATISGPQELYFESPAPHTIEIPWTPVRIICDMRTSLDVPEGPIEWYFEEFERKLESPSSSESLPQDIGASAQNPADDFTTSPGMKLENIERGARKTLHELTGHTKPKPGRFVRSNGHFETSISLTFKDTFTVQHEEQHDINGAAMLRVPDRFSSARCVNCHRTATSSVFQNLVNHTSSGDTETSKIFEERWTAKRYRIDPETTMIRMRTVTDSEEPLISLQDLSRRQLRVGKPKTAHGILDGFSEMTLTRLSHTFPTHLEIMYPESTGTGVVSAIKGLKHFTLSGLTLQNRERNWQDAGSITVTHERHSTPTVLRRRTMQLQARNLMLGLKLTEGRR